jgi:hypothetical protein
MGNYEYVKHMIARFGDELLPFEELERKSINRLKKRMTDKLKSSLSAIDSTVDEFFNPTRYNSEVLRIEFNGVTYNHRCGS